MTVTRQTMTQQEMFDRAMIGVIKQGRRSQGPADGCKYRGPSGLKCAVGHLLNDNEYDPKMDNLDDTDVRSLLKYREEYELTLPEWWNSDNVEMLKRLQKIHDNEMYWGRYGVNAAFAQGAEDIAFEFGLSFDNVKAALKEAGVALD